MLLRVRFVVGLRVRLGVQLGVRLSVLCVLLLHHIVHLLDTLGDRRLSFLQRQLILPVEHISKNQSTRERCCWRHGLVFVKLGSLSSARRAAAKRATSWAEPFWQVYLLWRSLVIELIQALVAVLLPAKVPFILQSSTQSLVRAKEELVQSPAGLALMARGSCPSEHGLIPPLKWSNSEYRGLHLSTVQRWGILREHQALATVCFELLGQISIE
mmetsp:Transcript_4786/g.7312  ORF Transcript_4786/g.7312 Transcript_4786/m.7312 type:complete len:214 (+) Transcript_4786:753-1394(+)